jgi:hypothetical protein
MTISQQKIKEYKDFKNLLAQLSTHRQQSFPSIKYKTPFLTNFNMVQSMKIEVTADLSNRIYC